MKRITHIWIAAIVLAASLASAQDSTTQQQSLGAYARTVRKDKVKDQKPAAAKKYDNDNLPVNDKLSIVGNAGTSETPANGSSIPGNGSEKNDCRSLRSRPAAFSTPQMV